MFFSLQLLSSSVHQLWLELWITRVNVWSKSFQDAHIAAAVKYFIELNLSLEQKC